jgi:Zn-dependent protease
VNETIILIFQLAVLLFSVMVHEVSHGVVAHALGDDTAKETGRLTLNPLKHLDPFGSVILPLMLFLTSGGSLIFGWAKPVPYNPYRLKNPGLGAALIGVAGPITNFLLAIIFSVLIRVIISTGIGSLMPLVLFFNIIVFLNVLLGIFNLVPIPPLDGSRLVLWLIPDRYLRFKILLEQYGLLILLFFIFWGFRLIFPIIQAVYLFLVGSGAV